MLTPQQQVARKGRLTASRIAVLMNMVPEEVMNLYLEFIGEKMEDDLSEYWPAYWGSRGEDAHLDWIEMRSGQPITKRGHVVFHPTLSWAACTLDGWDCILRCPVESKIVGGREPWEVIVDRYQPQCQWQMFVTGTTQCALSVIMGADEPRVEYIVGDGDYMKEMCKRGEMFMDCVSRRVPPVALAPVPPPFNGPFKPYDMTGNNKWGDAAGKWRETREAARQNEAAALCLKGLVPEDASRAEGHGAKITRDKNGRLSLRESK